MDIDVASRLKILDIAVWESHLTRSVEYPAAALGENIEFQTMRHVRADSVSAIDDDGNEIDLLKIFVSLGVRGVALAENESSEDTVLHTLETTFSVDYLRLSEITEDEVAEFARFNAVHNVWPFWRQHVYDTMKKASLPLPEIPFFSGKSLAAEE